MDLEQRDPRKRKLDNYRENWFKLSDGSLMKVALCSDCNDSIDGDMAQNIIQRHFDTWTQQIEEDLIWTQEKKDQSIAALQINKQLVDFNINHIEAITNNQEAINQAVVADQEEKMSQEESNIKAVENLSNNLNENL
jgi:hypothetical protein